MTIGIQALHGVIALASATPEIECNEAEAKSIADPLVRLMDHYAVVPPVEVVLAMNLATAVIAVEAPRIMLVRMRKMEERARAAKPVYDSPAASPSPTMPDLSVSFGGGAAGTGSVN